MVTRRNFIQSLGLASVAGTILNLSGIVLGQKTASNDYFPIPEESLIDPLLTFTSAHFLPFINTDFEIRQENLRGTESLRLLDVKKFESKANLAAGVQSESFSLLFSSPKESELTSGQYEFTHFSLGTFRLSVNPVSAEANRFEAVINHLKR